MFTNILAGRNYSRFFSEQAVYAPALSPNYVKFANGTKRPIVGAPYFRNDFNFLNPQSQLFFYPWALYSAGQAAKTEGAAKKESWITKKNRHQDTHVISDSGGFQYQGGKLKFEGNITCERMLRWMENTGDYSMVLDFPTGGIEAGTVAPHVKRLEGQGIDLTKEATEHGFSKEYMACLMQSEINNKYFVSHRIKDGTNLLNVIQGRNENESRFWYERMKGFPFEGIAFAGKHSTEFSMTLKRIFQMLQDGLLQKCPWIHFLGISTLRTSLALTFLQRELRAHSMCNEKIQISFDSSNPSSNLKNAYTAYTGVDFSTNRWSFLTTSLGDQSLNDDERTLNEISEQSIQPAEGRKFIRSTIGQFYKPGMMMTHTKAKDRMSPNGDSQNCLVNHNIEMMVRIFRELNRFTQPAARGVPQSISSLDALMVAIFQQTHISDVSDKIDQLASVLDELAIGGT